MSKELAIDALTRGPVDAPDFMSDYSDSFEAIPDDRATRELASLCVDLKQAEALVTLKEAELASALAQVKQLAEIDIPEKMASLGVSSFRLVDGSEVTTKPEVYPNISKANQQKAYQWLRENGHGDIIKSVVAVALGRGEDEAARHLASVLKEAGYGDRFSVEEKIHPQTLKAFVKELDEAGTPVPDAFFSVHRVNRARVK